MLFYISYWQWTIFLIVHFSSLITLISCQGLACYKCMTTDSDNDGCRDPFSSIINPIQSNCQATSRGKNGTFPARFCVKISGRIAAIESGVSASYLNTFIYYRTCVVDNIMESTKSLETAGNFRLKGFPDFNGTIRLQGFMSLCANDGCNSSQILYSSASSIIFMTLTSLVFLCKLFL